MTEPPEAASFSNAALSENANKRIQTRECVRAYTYKLRLRAYITVKRKEK